MLNYIFQNWQCDGSQESTNDIKNRFFSDSKRFLRLTQRMVRDENQKLIPNFEAFAALLLHRKRSAGHLKPAIDSVLRVVGKRIKSSPNSSNIKIVEIQAAGSQEITQGDLKKAIQLLGTASFSIHPFTGPDGEPGASYSIDARRYPNTLAAVDGWLTDTSHSSFFGAPALIAPFDLNSLSVSPEAHADAVKALERLDTDSRGAITSAKAALEAALKLIAHETGTSLTQNPSIHDLLRACQTPLGVEKPAMKRMLSSIVSLCQNIYELRNDLGDAHGATPVSVKPTRSEARYIVSSSLLLTAYLLERFDARKTV